MMLHRERGTHVSFPEISLSIPGWVEEMVGDRAYATVEDRMRLAVELSRENARRGTGGPFGAAVFESASGRLIAPGVNLVVGSGNSVAHAETVAIMVAQRVMGDFDLGAPDRPACELVASTEPCLMCLGVTIWSGVRTLVCGARDADAAAIGFDEGPKPASWSERLEERGISVRRDVLRDEAVGMLRDYASGGGEIYNARGGAPGDAIEG
jgi:tRNA(Arg) A34 adenosine deaminase TadA